MTRLSPIVTRRMMLRVMTTGGVLAASSTVLGCSTGRHAAEARGASIAASPGALVMIIRHGEKPDHSAKGVDINGNFAGKHSLTQVGWNRARALVELFAPSSGPLRPGLARPKLIYAAGADEGGSGERARETVTPLAQRLGIPINANFGKGDEQALATQITSQPGPTLICWQHGEIPAIAKAFGSLVPAPPDKWPGSRFDVIWTLTADGHGWNFAQQPEMVLPGDQPTIITS